MIYGNQAGFLFGQADQKKKEVQTLKSLWRISVQG